MTDLRDRMRLFHVIDDGVAVLRMKGGKYRQVAIYQRGDGVYAGLGGFYIRLMASGTTTDPNVSWIEAGSPQVVWRPGAKSPSYDPAALNAPVHLQRLAAS